MGAVTLSKEEMEKAIVLERLFMSNPDIKFSISTAKGSKTFTRKDIIDEVKRSSPFGVQYVQDQMEYTRSLASGEVLALLQEIEEL